MGCSCTMIVVYKAWDSYMYDHVSAASPCLVAEVWSLLFPLVKLNVSLQFFCFQIVYLRVSMDSATRHWVCVSAMMEWTAAALVRCSKGLVPRPSAFRLCTCVCPWTVQHVTGCVWVQWWSGLQLHWYGAPRDSSPGLLRLFVTALGAIATCFYVRSHNKKPG